MNVESLAVRTDIDTDDASLYGRTVSYLARDVETESDRIVRWRRTYVNDGVATGERDRSDCAMLRSRESKRILSEAR